MCEEGQRWCTGFGVDSSAPSEFCCNWYVDKRCVVTCPGALQGDIGGTEMQMFDCGKSFIELAIEDNSLTLSLAFQVVVNCHWPMEISPTPTDLL